VKATNADRKRFDAFQAIGCVACAQRGRYSVAEVHHLKSGNRRRGHQFTVPLCPAHHRGVDHDIDWHGPSLALSPREFHRVFGSDDYLLARTEMMLKGQWDDHVL
jgi:hypothetical protein